LIEIGSKTAEKNCTNKQTNRQTNRHYENNGHLAVNQKYAIKCQQLDVEVRDLRPLVGDPVKLLRGVAVRAAAAALDVDRSS